MHVFNTLAPVFLIIALGWLLRVSGFISGDLLQGINRLAYWVALPCLLFFEAATSRVDFFAHSRPVVILLAAMLVCIVAGYLAAAALRVPAEAAGTLVQASFRGNLAFVGLPVAIYSLGNQQGIVPILAVVIPSYNIISVLVLLAGRHKFSARAVGTVALHLATNPLILSCVAGMLYAWSGAPLPLAARRTLEALKSMALPLALLGVGGALELRKLRGQFSPILAAGLIKVVLAPLAGYALARLMGLGHNETSLALIFLTCPTATSSYVMADQMGGDGHLAAGAIVFSTLLALASLCVVVAL